MAFVSTYLNFQGKTEEAMKFYAKAFGTESTLKIMHFSDMPFGYWGCALDKYGIRWMVNVAPVTNAG